MDLGKFLWVKGFEGKYFILDLPSEFASKMSEVRYEFRYNSEMEIEVLETKNVRNNTYLKTEYIKKIHVYDSNRKMIYRFKLVKAETDVKSYDYGDVKWLYKFEHERSLIQVKETVEAMFGHGLFDGNDNINYTPEQIKELLKNYK